MQTLNALGAIEQSQSDQRVVAAVRAAADATGVSFEYLLAQANQESGLDPSASNRRSSASGLFQFTASTWLDMVRRHGAAIGLDDYADAITKGADGHLTVADKSMRKAILDLRQDPKISARMAAEYAKDNQRILQGKLGRPVSAHDLTLAHFLGAGGAAKVLEGMGAQPRNSAAHLLPEAARANPEVFREPGSRKARSVASLYNVVQARFSGALGEVAPMVGTATAMARTDLAALHPQPRPEAATTTPALRPDPGEQVAAAPEPAASPFGETQSASPFANAVEPPSPFFPVPIAPRRV